MKLTTVFYSIATLCLLLSATACDQGAKRREPRSVYMADMYKSRSYQSQTNDDFYAQNIGNKRPHGVIARGEVVGYDLPNTNEGYVLSAGVKNPLSIDSATLEKGKVYFAHNCVICHGEKLDGEGYLYRGGDGPYPAKPATLVGDEKYEAMPDGTMFHSIYYGKNLMGSYASQLTQKEIWMVVAYIKAQQKMAQSQKQVK